MPNIHDLRIDGDRLWNRLMTMAQIGATAKGGVNRVTLTDEDKAGRDLFIEWCKAAGCTITIDQMGNIFARRAGADDMRLPVMAGSHLDSQPTGGKYDGVLGVLAALEVVETLNDQGITTQAPLEIVSWTNEEGARFAPAMLASGVFAGIFDLEYGLSRTDKDGKSVGEELERIGYAGEAEVGDRAYQATFEIHIEQGPILEATGNQIGIVTGVQGMQWYTISIEGKETHAGTTPMDRRKDPMRAAWPIWQGLYELADEYEPDVRLTIGDVVPSPGVINTVPGKLNFALDIRHPDANILSDLDEAVNNIVNDISDSSGLPAEVEKIWYSPPVEFAADCVDAVRRAAEVVGAPAMEIISGAGHDAVYIASVAPTSMIFIPCKDGLSHNELESAEKEDVVAGGNVLLHAMLAQARVTSDENDPS